MFASLRDSGMTELTLVSAFWIVVNVLTVAIEWVIGCPAHKARV